MAWWAHSRTRSRRTTRANRRLTGTEAAVVGLWVLGLLLVGWAQKHEISFGDFPFGAMGSFAIFAGVILGLRRFTEDPAAQDSGQPVDVVVSRVSIVRVAVIGAFCIIALGVARAAGWLDGEFGRHLAGLAIVLFGMAVVTDRLVVGTDGLLVGYLLRDFVPYSELENVKVDGDSDLIIQWKSGREMRVSAPYRSIIGNTNSRGSTDARHTRFRDRIYVAIREGIERYGQVTGERETIEVLRRGPRSATEWLADMRQIRLNAASYRERSMEPEQLLRVAQDTTAPDDARVAAAHVLRNNDDEAFQRFRVANEGTISPSLRAAFDALDAESEAARDAALNEIAESEEKNARRQSSS